ncbi:glycoside hydrolase family 97 protein [Halomontanus rarus]|uniref:glycoside hydrolase family 97 protein n=1 Tax=Halomontanus rarus TaxID=3034020 RepID=UPI0023E80B31|nr:glycoside hydrolase family 97 protein [Halovivax sp. TS33]
MGNNQSSGPPTDAKNRSVDIVHEGASGYTLTSPNEDRAVTVVTEGAGESVEMTTASGTVDAPVVARYEVTADGETVIGPSRLGLAFADDDPEAVSGYEVLDVDSTSIAEEWEPVWGEWETVTDAYNELTLALRERSDRGRRIDLVIRAYDEGIAVRYRLPGDSPSTVNVMAELTEFTVREDAKLYGSWHESEYQRLDPTNVRVADPHGDRVDRLESPVVVETPDAPWAAVAEANVDGYPRLTLVGRDGGPGLVSDVTEPVHVREDRDDRPADVKADDSEHTRVEPPFSTPWRAVLLGSSLADLRTSSVLVQNLNEPCRIDDTSWITPGLGLVARTTTTEGARRYVDRAAELGFTWLVWDGPEAYYDADQWDPEADATTTREGFDVPTIIDYADHRGVKIMFYLQHFYIQRNRDAILDRFAEWGVHGIKIGFVNVGPQEWTDWHRETVRMAAERGIHVDIHDQHRPDGFARTYPNLIAIEGGRGNEWADSYPPNGETPWGRPMAAHNVDLVLTRNLIGPFDYTYNYMPDGDLALTTTHAHKLAQSVVTFHPYTDAFRRDRSGRLVEMDDPAEKLAGLSFWHDLPTTWDDTHVLEARISELASVARRSGDDWYVGVITGENPHHLDISLDFLDPGREYEATIYEHNEDAETIDRVRTRARTVTRDDALTADVAAESGVAVRLFQVS